MTRRLLGWVSLSVTVVVAGCGGPSDLSQTPKYASVIGAEYRTKAELYAHGVYGSISNKQLSSIWIAPVEQTGPEIAFRRIVRKGQALRVIAVRKRFAPLDNGLQFVVTMDGLDLPTGVPIVVPLSGYMQSDDGFLDQRYFERGPAQ